MYVGSITAPPIGNNRWLRVSRSRLDLRECHAVDSIQSNFLCCEVRDSELLEMRQPDEGGLRRTGQPGFDLRTFECAKCSTGTTFLVAV